MATAFQVDGVQCFTYVTENVPSWIERVSALAKHCAQKHAEFAEEYKKLAHTITPRRRKNSSVHSIHSSAASRAGVSGTQSARRRKRDQDEASRVSGEFNQVLRNRHRLVIHYDGYTQKELEQFTRDLGIARNNIRKGRIAEMMRNPSAGLDMMPSTMSSAALLGRSQPDSAQAEADSSQTGERQENIFDAVDKQLEAVQNLFEIAAHQSLRCGDCSREFQQAQEKLGTVQESAKEAMQRLQEIRAKEPPPSEQTTTEPLVEKIKIKNVKIDGPTSTGSQTPPASKPTNGMSIEVDDADSNSSVSLDLTAFKARRLRR